MSNKKREVLIFGDGDLGIAVGGEKGSPTNELIIYKLNRPVLPIGKKLKGHIGKTTDELNTLARWRFKKPESIQVVIDALEGIKKKIPCDERGGGGLMAKLHKYIKVEKIQTKHGELIITCRLSRFYAAKYFFIIAIKVFFLGVKQLIK